MASLLAIGFGAGLASALLFAVVVTGSPLALVLSLVAPLPILIAVLGWNHRAGFVGAFAGAAAVALAFRPAAGLAFALGSRYGLDEALAFAARCAAGALTGRGAYVTAPATPET
jgi:hypothetical protein